MKYDILEASIRTASQSYSLAGMADFAKKVQAYVDKGWEPLGGISVSWQPNTAEFRVMQAIIFRDTPENGA